MARIRASAYGGLNRLGRTPIDKLRAELRSPSPAFLIACLALFVAMGGTSVAAVTLKKNSVRGKHIAKNAVTAPKVRNASLLSEDFAPGQLPSGPQGERGSEGIQGPPGATKVAVRNGGQSVATPDGANTSSASCNPGERAVGGGFEPITATYIDMVVVRSEPIHPSGPPTGWEAQVLNRDNNGDDSGNVTFRAVVVCASP